jgi:tRNA(Ile)-lysidine synthase
MHFNPDALFRALRPVFHAQRYVVALSGGLDSVVLLHGLSQLPLSQPIIALHINHQLSPNANVWQAHCREWCAEMKIPLFTRVVNIVMEGYGLEDAARRARYGEFAEFLGIGDCLLSAHHQNDQAETFLLRLVRGSGTRGLSGMPLSRQLGEGYIFRPLLNFPRSSLLEYATQHELRWVEDESNDSEQFDRNFIRKQIVQPLRERWPSILDNVMRSARLSREAEELSREMAAIDLFACYAREDRWGYSLALPYLKGCSRVRQKNAVRFWLEEKELSSPGQARLEEIVDHVIHAAEDSNPCVAWDGIECRRFGGRLYLINALCACDVASSEFELSAGHFVAIPGVGEVSLSSEAGAGLHVHPGDKLSVRFRQGSERCKPMGRRHSQTLKKLLQEYAVPPWVRDRTPLVYINGKMAAVGDFWINDGFAVVSERERGFVVSCDYDLH